ncbi:MAG: phosphatidate cytidylyltransferase [Flavobacteriales bacterium]|nr:phosphatidate cytidylyltransferase [Flavobacteriales bacterium]
MNENIKRGFSGLIYISVMWFCTSYSTLTFSILFLVIGIISFYEMLKLRHGKSKLIALLFISVPFIMIHFFGLFSLSNQNELINNRMILFIFILTWTFDTFAYIFGINFGKRKILPSISPKKSWEGFLGGLIFTLIASYITTLNLFEIDISKAMIISLFIPFTATLGDFTESYYKRQAGVKDSGNFIPGHGGMLDRMDAFLFTIPLLYIFLTFL